MAEWFLVRSLLSYFVNFSIRLCFSSLLFNSHLIQSNFLFNYCICFVSLNVNYLIKICLLYHIYNYWVYSDTYFRSDRTFPSFHQSGYPMSRLQGRPLRISASARPCRFAGPLARTQIAKTLSGWSHRADSLLILSQHQRWSSNLRHIYNVIIRIFGC